MDPTSILIIDDDRRSRSAFARSLQRKLNVTVDLHDNLLQVEQLRKGASYDVACIDSSHSVLPVETIVDRLSGTGAVSAARFLLLLKEYDLQSALRAISTGCHGWIGRPFQADLVSQKIRQILKTDPPTRHPLPKNARPRVLIAEGNERYRDVISHLLSDMGPCIEAVSGFDAAVSFHLYQPRTILISSSLDGWSHERLIRIIRSKQLDPPPVIYVTVYDNSKEVAAYLSDLGVTGCLRKATERILLQEIFKHFSPPRSPHAVHQEPDG